MHPTITALVQRGLNQTLAESLWQKGFTLGKLKQTNSAGLIKLGIAAEYHEAIKSGSRPPIPNDIANDVLYKSDNTCAACHNRQLGVQLHHIIPWSICKTHEEKNLIALCMPCHDKAESKGGLTKKYDRDQLLHHKRVWEKEVSEAKTRSLFSPRPHNLMRGTWDYFNRQRILDSASALSIDLKRIKGVKSLKNDDHRRDRDFRYQGELQIGPESEVEFFRNLLRRIAAKRDWIDLGKIWSRGQFRVMLPAQTLFALTANFHFQSPKGKVKPGPGQNRTAYYRRGGLRVAFAFDAWEATSNSAHAGHLRGNSICTVLGLVRSLELSDGVLTVRSTCLAIGTGLAEYERPWPDIAYINQAKRNADADAGFEA